MKKQIIIVLALLLFPMSVSLAQSTCQTYPDGTEVCTHFYVPQPAPQPQNKKLLCHMFSKEDIIVCTFVHPPAAQVISGPSVTWK